MPSDRTRSRGKLVDFAAIPQRAIGDRRLSEVHLRVLAAICRPVNPQTWTALITQQRIAEWAGYHRNTVGRNVPDLERWGYVTIHKRGRQRSESKTGRFKTHLYEIHYDRPLIDPAQKEQGTAHAPSDECNTVHHQRGAESDSLESDIHINTRGGLANGESNAPGPHIESLDPIVGSARNDISPTARSMDQAYPQTEGSGAVAKNDSGLDLAEVMKLADEFDDICEEAERLGVDRSLLVRLKSARDAAAAYVSFERLCDIALFAESQPGDIEDQIRFMIGQYEAIVSVYARRS